jgi:hypothetical protein
MQREQDAARQRDRYAANPEGGRAYCRSQYAKHAEKRRAARRARYYANLEAERESARVRMGGYSKPSGNPRMRRLQRMDSRWAQWARELGIKIQNPLVTEAA